MEQRRITRTELLGCEACHVDRDFHRSALRCKTQGDVVGHTELCLCRFPELRDNGEPDEFYSLSFTPETPLSTWEGEPGRERYPHACTSANSYSPRKSTEFRIEIIPKSYLDFKVQTNRSPCSSEDGAVCFRSAVATCIIYTNPRQIEINGY